MLVVCYVNSVNHDNHCVSGFNCQHVYWAHLHEGICEHELSEIEVVSTVLSGENQVVVKSRSCEVFESEADDSEVTGEKFETDEVSQNNPTGKGAMMTPEAIAGIVMGIVVIVAVVLVIILFVVRRRKMSSGTVREENGMESEPTTVTTTTGTAYPLVTTGNYNETPLNQVLEARDSFRDSAEEEI